MKQGCSILKQRPRSHTLSN